jgi:thiol-disulfide isomerase/thioredoxin
VELKVRRGSKIFSATCKLTSPPPAAEVIKRHLIGSAAPQLTLYALDQTQSERKHVFEVKPTVLFFWATWCRACKPVFPILESVRERWKDQVAILGISYESADRLQSYQRAHSPPFELLRDPDQAAHDQYLVTAIPTIVLIDRSGNVAGLLQDPKEFNLLEKKVENIINPARYED